jgi:hypothetical protein
MYNIRPIPSVPSLLTVWQIREVHRAEHIKTKADVALKKIIMHNEKDGVRSMVRIGMVYCQY